MKNNKKQTVIFDRIAKSIKKVGVINAIEDIDIERARGPHNETLLHYLAIEGYFDAVNFLGENGAKLDVRNDLGTTALIDVVVLDMEKMVELLLQIGADPNLQDSLGNTALHKAFEYNSSERVKMLLLEAGASPGKVNNLNETPEDCQ